MQKQGMAWDKIAGLGALKTFVAPCDLGVEKTLSFKGRLLDKRHYKLILNRTGRVMTPDGETLCILIKNYLSRDLLDAIRPIVRKVAHKRVAPGNRGDAAGTGMLPRRRSDGSLSLMKGVPRLEDLSDEDFYRLNPAREGVFGYIARDIRGGKVYPARFTAYKNVLPSELRLMSELAKEVSDAYRLFAKDKWEAQFKAARQTPAFVLKTPEGVMPISTATCNRNWRTAGHVDRGNLKEGYVVMCSLGNFKGCALVFPRYKVAVHFGEGDILIGDLANQLHGNSPLLNPDGTVPKPNELPERLVCIFYYQAAIAKCCKSASEEMDFVNRRKKGDRMYSKA